MPYLCNKIAIVSTVSRIVRFDRSRVISVGRTTPLGFCTYWWCECRLVQLLFQYHLPQPNRKNSIVRSSAINKLNRRIGGIHLTEITEYSREWEADKPRHEACLSRRELFDDKISQHLPVGIRKSDRVRSPKNSQSKELTYTILSRLWKVSCCCWSSTEDIASVASLPSATMADLSLSYLVSAVLSLTALSAEWAGSLDFDRRLKTSAA